MGRRRGASYRPAYDADGRQPQTASHVRHPAVNAFGPVSYPLSASDIYAMVDSWISYRSDNNTSLQKTMAAASDATPSAVSTSRPPELHGNAPEFQPRQSRYNFRQRTDEQMRPFSTGAYESIVDSIEPRDAEPRAQPQSSTSQRMPQRRAYSRQTTPRWQHEEPVTPLPEPKVDDMYTKRAMEAPVRLSLPRKLLVILDLNGTLMVRKRGESQKGRIRPGAQRLLNYLFENHMVMVSTSTRLVNAQKLLALLMTPKQRQKLVTIRARETFGLTPEQYAAKVQIYKNLEDIWLDTKVQDSAKGLEQPWSQINTILVDDSIIKAMAQPHSLLQVPEFEIGGPQPGQKNFKQWEQGQLAVMRSVEEKLEILKWQHNVTCQIRRWQLGGELEAPGVVDVIPDHGARAGTLKQDSTGAEGYMTPQSLAPESDTGVGQVDRGQSETPLTEEGFQDLLGMRKLKIESTSPERLERPVTPRKSGRPS